MNFSVISLMYVNLHGKCVFSYCHLYVMPLIHAKATPSCLSVAPLHLSVRLIQKMLSVVS